MALPTAQYITGVKITAKLKAAPHTNKVIHIANRLTTDAAALDDDYIWPLLISCSEVGVEADLYMPKVQGGTFILDNSTGSLGWSRKFTDLLQRYTIIEQPVEIHLAELALDDSGLFSLDATTLVYSGKITSWADNSASGEQTIAINFSSDAIPDTQMAAQLEQGSTSYTLDAGAIGKYSPMIFKEAVVPAQYVGWTDSTSDYGVFTYGTTRYTGFVPAINACYFRTHADTFAANNCYGQQQGTTPDTDQAFNNEAARAWLARLTRVGGAAALGSDGALLYGVTFKMLAHGYGGYVTTMNVFARVYTVAKGGTAIIDEVGGGTVAMTTYATQNNAGGGASFDATIYFDETIPLDLTKYDYAIGFSAANWTSADASLGCDSGVTSYARWRYSKSATAGDDISTEWLYRSGTATLVMRALTAYAASYDYIGAVGSERTAVVAYEATGAIDKLANVELYVNAYGYLDMAGAIVTAFSAVTRPDQVIDMLTRTWNGSSYDQSTAWDFAPAGIDYDAAYTTGRIPRTCSGYLEGARTLPEIIEQICRETATRIGMDNAGKMFVWPWGLPGTPVATIRADLMIPEAWETLDITSVTNKMRVRYYKDALKAAKAANLLTGETSNYLSTLSADRSTAGKLGLLATESFNCYGEREAADQELEICLNADVVAEQRFATGAHPTEYATFQVPYQDYKALKMFDVIHFGHPAYPAFHGSNADCRELVETTSMELANTKEGYPHMSFEPYRGLIEARWLVLPLIGSQPMLRFRVRVLNNYPGDPT
jgi:hypothetical protein